MIKRAVKSRNLRKKPAAQDVDDDADARAAVSPAPSTDDLPNSAPSAPASPRQPSVPPLTTFGDGNDGDDNNVVRIKKSTLSRRGRPAHAASVVASSSKRPSAGTPTPGTPKALAAVEEPADQTPAAPRNPFASRALRTLNADALAATTPVPAAPAPAVIDMTRPTPPASSSLIISDGDELMRDEDGASRHGSDSDSDDDEAQRQWELAAIRRGGALAASSDMKREAELAVHDLAKGQVSRVPSVPALPTTADVLAQLQRALANMNDEHASRAAMLAQTQAELERLSLSIVQADADLHALGTRFEAAQTYRDFVVDYADWCTVARPVLDDLERVWLRGPFGTKADDEDREGAMDLDASDNDDDAMDVDSATTQSLTDRFAATVTTLRSRATTELWADVRPEFTSLDTLLGHLVAFKRTYPDDYRRANVAELLPVVVATHVRADLVAWDLTPLESRAWHAAIAQYGAPTAVDRPLNMHDADARLMDRVVALAVVPAVTARLAWIDYTDGGAVRQVVDVWEEILYVEHKESAAFQDMVAHVPRHAAAQRARLAAALADREDEPSSTRSDAVSPGSAVLAALHRMTAHLVQLQRYSRTPWPSLFAAVLDATTQVLESRPAELDAAAAVAILVYFTKGQAPLPAPSSRPGTPPSSGELPAVTIVGPAAASTPAARAPPGMVRACQALARAMDGHGVPATTVAPLVAWLTLHGVTETAAALRDAAAGAGSS
ncbi:hypothetical protein AMAG_08253 [Allomyces macrogynus ATCC 38327]|uniref:GCF C-terminal domain-containing protein n=1 Tax=Allomyces macrogynus (strain ATCC 38327) TaxID=578462 RepID=A0A0L0SKP0_ALLM3|nr:hypothetical protein AMAG_08253 [Allomyces macrogynus ATCC 38327]|eukprot:KNE63087.1 hypothetical protein AMAG_08253 [Allomyces macrogynus ATCC 38327]